MEILARNSDGHGTGLLKFKIPMKYLADVVTSQRIVLQVFESYLNDKRT